MCTIPITSTRPSRITPLPSYCGAGGTGGAYKDGAGIYVAPPRPGDVRVVDDQVAARLPADPHQVANGYRGGHDILAFDVDDSIMWLHGCATPRVVARGTEPKGAAGIYFYQPNQFIPKIF